MHRPAERTGFSPEVSLDLSRLNFLGVGQSIGLHGLYSRLETRGSLSYLVPRLGNVQGRDLTFTLLYDNALNVRTFASRREEASVQLSEKFSKSITGSFRMAYRRVSVSSVVIPVLLVPELLQPVRIGILSASFAQDRRDDKSDPHRGIYNTADIGVAGRFFGGQRGFVRVLVRNATYYRLTRNLVLAGKPSSASSRHFRRLPAFRHRNRFHCRSASLEAAPIHCVRFPTIRRGRETLARPWFRTDRPLSRQASRSVETRSSSIILSSVFR